MRGDRLNCFFLPDLNRNDATPSSFGFDVQGSIGNTVGGLGGLPEHATVNVDAVNDEPSFTLAQTSVTVAEDSVAFGQDGFATGFNPGGGSDEASQVPTYQVFNSFPGLFSAQPSIDAAGRLTFTLNPNVFGTVTVTVRVNDGGGIANGGDDTSPDQFFTITVQAVADTPTVTPATTDEDALTTSGLVVTRNPADGSEVTHFQVTSIQGGSVYLADGTTPVAAGDFVAFDGTGVAQLRFRSGTDLNDNFGVPFGFDVQASMGANVAGLGGPKATAAVGVTPVNDEPTFAIPANPPAIDEDAGIQTVSGFATSFQPGPATAIDEGTQMAAAYTVTLISATGNLSFTAVPSIASNGTLTYTPAANTNGTATFTVRVADDGLATPPNDNTSGDLTFTITVNAINDAPTFTIPAAHVANEDTGPQTVPGFATLFQPGPAAATDETGQTLAAYTVTVTGGTLAFTTAPALALDGTLTFHTAPNSHGTATISVVARDSGSGTAPNVNVSPSMAFLLTVNPVNDAPVVFDKAVTWSPSQGSAPFSSLLADATDVEGDPLTALLVTPPPASQGTVTLHADGTFSFTPAGDFTGTTSFTYRASDGQDNGNVATVVINVLASLNQQWLTRAYLDLVHRLPSAEEIAFRLSQLSGGESRASVALDILNAMPGVPDWRSVASRDLEPESHRVLVEGLFRLYLGSSPSPRLLKRMADLLDRGQTVEYVAAQILGSPGFVRRTGRGRRGYVNGLFQAIFGRLPTGAERKQAVRSLRNGAKTRLALKLINTDEARRFEVAQLSLQLLGQPAPDNLVAEAATKLANGSKDRPTLFGRTVHPGARLQQVIADVVGSDLYYRKL